MTTPPPANVAQFYRCSSCNATQSPEWRKGPRGNKELCNACGLRYARAQAKTQ
ncbi:GATA zinc finger-domain-containing protein [Mycena olivaceomarginata]|nr:GATA zinc finger-domain-containing protein [Mycena olivaceomarginata]